MQVVRLRRVDRLLQAALELTPVDESGQAVMARLVGHLARKAAQLADVVQDDDGTDGGAIIAANWRYIDLD